jgi:hypothetical protein
MDCSDWETAERLIEAVDFGLPPGWGIRQPAKTNPLARPWHVGRLVRPHVAEIWKTRPFMLRSQ